MAEFSGRSRERLSTCDARLIAVCEAAIKRTDFTVLCGHRTREDQDAAFERGTSKLRWPFSKHNSYPSKAVDLAPYPIDWKDIGRFREMMEIIAEEGKRLGVALRFGWDWNGNGKADEKFIDWPHVEIKED